MDVMGRPRRPYKTPRPMTHKRQHLDAAPQKALMASKGYQEATTAQGRRGLCLFGKEAFPFFSVLVLAPNPTSVTVKEGLVRTCIRSSPCLFAFVHISSMHSER